MVGHESLGEKALENFLCAQLLDGDSYNITITNSTSDARTLSDLISGFGYEIFQDTSESTCHSQIRHVTKPRHK